MGVVQLLELLPSLSLPPRPPVFLSQRLALCLKIIVFFQLAVSIAFVVSQRYVDAGISLGAALFGLACFGFNASEDGFSIQTTVCYMSFAFVMLFWALTRTVFFFLGKEVSATALNSWQAIVFQSAIISDIVIYFAASLTSYLLYSVRPRVNSLFCSLFSLTSLCCTFLFTLLSPVPLHLSSHSTGAAPHHRRRGQPRSHPHEP